MEKVYSEIKVTFRSPGVSPLTLQRARVLLSQPFMIFIGEGFEHNVPVDAIACVKVPIGESLWAKDD